MSLLFDVGRMFLLTWASWAVSKWFTTKELKNDERKEHEDNTRYIRRKPGRIGHGNTRRGIIS